MSPTTPVPITSRHTYLYIHVVEELSKWGSFVKWCHDSIASCDSKLLTSLHRAHLAGVVVALVNMGHDPG